MGKLTTHVLDTMNGCPAAGMSVVLWRLDPQGVPQLVLGLTENGVDYSYDEYNRTVLTPAMKKFIDTLNVEIVSA